MCQVEELARYLRARAMSAAISVQEAKQGTRDWAQAVARRDAYEDCLAKLSLARAGKWDIHERYAKEGTGNG